MKIRKVFEKLSDYYTEISEFDFYNEDFENDNYQPLTKQQVNIIIDKFPFLSVSPVLKVFKELSPTYKEELYRLYISIPAVLSGIITLYAHNDEWFFVKMSYDKIKKGKGFSEVLLFYKCDQFDGLLKCLENNFKKLI